VKRTKINEKEAGIGLYLKKLNQVDLGLEWWNGCGSFAVVASSNPGQRNRLKAVKNTDQFL